MCHSVEVQTSSHSCGTVWKLKHPHTRVAQCGSSNILTLVWHSVEAQTSSPASGTVWKPKQSHAEWKYIRCLTF